MVGAGTGSHTITANWKDIGAKAGVAYTVRDAIAHADLPDASATITVRTTNFMTIKKIAFNYVLQCYTGSASLMAGARVAAECECGWSHCVALTMNYMTCTLAASLRVYVVQAHDVGEHDIAVLVLTPKKKKI